MHRNKYVPRDINTQFRVPETGSVLFLGLAGIGESTNTFTQVLSKRLAGLTTRRPGDQANNSRRCGKTQATIGFGAAVDKSRDDGNH